MSERQVAPGGAILARRQLMLGIAGVVALFLILYAPSLGHPFVWDDALLLEDNPRVTAPDAWSIAVTSHYLALFKGAARDTAFYRPLSSVLLLVEQRLFGDDPRGYRVVHALWHLVNALLVLFAARALIRRGSDGTAGAALAAALFVALPHSVDAVLFLTDIGDQLVLTCALLGAFAFESQRRRGGALPALAIGGCTLAGLLAKESAIAIPAMLLFLHLLRREGTSDRRAAIGLAASGAAVAIYLALRTIALPAAGTPDLARAVLDYPATLAVALRWSLAPHPLVLEQLIGGDGHLAWTVAGAVCLLGGIVAAVLLRRRFPDQVALGLAWLLCVTPSALAPSAVHAFAPRYLYLPGAALALLFALVIANRRWPVRAAAAGLVLGLGLLAFVRIGTWGDPLALWSNEVEHAPDRAPAWIHLANALADHERYEAALRANSRAATIAATAGQGRLEAMARTNAAGLLAERFGRPGPALAELERAAAADPAYADAHVATGLIHARDGRWQAAERAFRRGLALDPWNLAAATGLAGALAAAGETDEALDVLEQARDRARGSPDLTTEIDRKIDVVRARNPRNNSSRGKK